MPTGRHNYVEFMSLLSDTGRWGGECVPNKVGSGNLNKRAVLLPQSELVWCELLQSAITSVGSTSIVEPTQSRLKPSLYFSDSVMRNPTPSLRRPPPALILLRRDVGDAMQVTARVVRLGHISRPIWQP